MRLDPAPTEHRAVTWLLLAGAILVFVLACYCHLGCAALRGDRRVELAVALVADPAGDLAADALAAQMALIPADPAGLEAWCLAAGLTPEEASLVAAEAGGELAAVLGALSGYLDDGAVRRLLLSALVAEPPGTVGPREAARALLAWARAHATAVP